MQEGAHSTSKQERSHSSSWLNGRLFGESVCFSQFFKPEIIHTIIKRTFRNIAKIDRYVLDKKMSILKRRIRDLRVLVSSACPSPPRATGLARFKQKCNQKTGVFGCGTANVAPIFCLISAHLHNLKGRQTFRALIDGTNFLPFKDCYRPPDQRKLFLAWFEIDCDSRPVKTISPNDQSYRIFHQTSSVKFPVNALHSMQLTKFRFPSFEKSNFKASVVWSFLQRVH